MTSLAHTYTTEHLGMAEHGTPALAQLANRIRATVKARFQAWLAARRQAAADARYWELAQTDHRVMADISRAMSQAALDDTRAYR